MHKHRLFAEWKMCSPLTSIGEPGFLSVNRLCNCLNLCHYSKNPCWCGNWTFSNKVHRRPGKHKAAGQVLSRFRYAPIWEMCNFCTGMGFCFYPMTCKKHQGSHVEITHFHTLLFCMNCVLVMGKKFGREIRRVVGRSSKEMGLQKVQYQTRVYMNAELL